MRFQVFHASAPDGGQGDFGYFALLVEVEIDQVTGPEFDGSIPIGSRSDWLEGKTGVLIVPFFGQFMKTIERRR